MEYVCIAVPFIMNWGFVVFLQAIVFGLTSLLISYLPQENNIIHQPKLVGLLQFALLVSTVLILVGQLWSETILLFTLLLTPILLSAGVYMNHRYLRLQILIAIITSFCTSLLVIAWILEEAFRDFSF